eukprot:4293259-Pyramimonas_sp.AAC.1
MVDHMLASSFTYSGRHTPWIEHASPSQHVRGSCRTVGLNPTVHAESAISGERLEAPRSDRRFSCDTNLTHHSGLLQI